MAPITCNAYDSESPTIPPLIVPRLSTAKTAAANTARDPTISSRIPSHLHRKIKKDFCQHKLIYD